MTQMTECNRTPRFTELANRGTQGATGAAPSKYQHVGTIGIINCQRLNDVRCTLNLLGTSANHVFVIITVVGHVAGHVFFLKPTKAMLKSRSSRYSPLT